MNEPIETIDLRAEFVREPAVKTTASRETPRRISAATVEQFDQVREGKLPAAVAAYVRLFGLSPRGWSSEWRDEGNHVLIKRWKKENSPKFFRANYVITGGEYVFDEPREVVTADRASQVLDRRGPGSFSVLGVPDRRKPGAFSVR